MIFGISRQIRKLFYALSFVKNYNFKIHIDTFRLNIFLYICKHEKFFEANTVEEYSCYRTDNDGNANACDFSCVQGLRH